MIAPTPWRERLHHGRRAVRSDEGGFTLIELIVALAVLAIIIVPLTAAFITTLQQTNAVDKRLAQSADAQRIGSAWTKDVRNVSATGFSTGQPCEDPTGSSPAEEILATFEWGSDPSYDGDVINATWVIEGTGSNMQLVRRLCVGGDARRGGETLLADSFGVKDEPPLDVVHSINGPGDNDMCTTTTCTIVIDGAFEYQITVARGVPGNDTGTLVAPLAPAVAGAVCGNGSLTVSWLPTPQPSGAGDPTAYRVVVTNANGDTANGGGNGDLVGPTATSAQVTGLTNGQDYWVQVQALVNTLPGSLSLPRYGPIQPCPAVPTAPTGLTVTRADQALNVSWAAPSDTGGSPITGWRIRARVAETGEVIGDTTVAGPSSGTVGSLTNGTEYEVTVAAVNAVGEGPESAGVLGTPSGVPFAPGAPSIVTSGDTVTLTWTEPDNNGAVIDSWRITATPPFTSANPLYASSPWIVNPTPNTRVDPDDLSEPLTYTWTTPPLPTGTRTFTVAAHNVAGWGPDSPSSSATTALGRPTLAPGDIKLTPLDAPASDNDLNHKAIKVTWVPIPDVPPYNGGSSITGYQVSITPNDFNGFNSWFVQGSNSAEYSIGNLTQIQAGAYKNYTVKVQAVNQIGAGLENPSDPETDATAQGTGIPGGVPIASPTGLTVVPLGIQANSEGRAQAQAQVRWTPVEDITANNGGNSICTDSQRGYNVNYTPSDLNFQSSNPADNCTNTEQGIDNLQRGTTYTYRVVARNFRGSSIPATTVSAPAPAPMTTPAATAVVLTRPTGTQGNRLSLVVPDLKPNAGSLTPDYSANCATSSGSPSFSKNFTGLSVGTNILTDPALENGRTFRCTLTAAVTYPIGGAHSVSQTSAAAVKVFAAPTAPTSLTVSQAAGGKAKLDWAAPASNGGDPVTGYRITTSPAISGSPFVLGNVSTWTSPNLSFGTTYTFSVQAINGCGCDGGDAATTGNFTPTSALPAAAPSGLAWAPTVSGPPASPITGVTVSWATFPTDGASTGGLPITEFEVTLTPDQSGASAQTKTVTGAGATSVNFTTAQLQTGGTAYRTYTATVRAKNANGAGPSTTLNNAKVGGIPLATATGLTYEPLAQEGYVRMKWTNPAWDAASGGGVAPTGYKLTRIKSSVFEKVETITGAQVLANIDTAKNSPYEIRLALYNDYGQALNPVTLSFTTPTDIGVPAGTPTLATSSTSGRLTLQVTAFTTTASTPPVTSYTASCTSSDGGVASGTRTVNASSNTLNGLTSGKTYTCAVTGSSPGWAGNTTQTKTATTNSAVVP